MAIEVFVADEQSDHPVDAPRWDALARNVLQAQKVRGDAELSVLFVDETTIAGLNERFLGKTGPTDVLAFPLDEDPDEPGRWPDAGGPAPGREPLEPEDLPTLLGDVVICPSVAARNAPEHAGTYDDELALAAGARHPASARHGPRRRSRRREDGAARTRTAPGVLQSVVSTVSPALTLVVAVLLVFFASFLAMAETSITRMSKHKATVLADEGKPGAAELLRITQQPEKYLNPVLLVVLGSPPRRRHARRARGRERVRRRGACVVGVAVRSRLPLRGRRGRTEDLGRAQ